MKTGTDLILEERKEQIEKHDKTILHDQNNNKEGQLIRSALAYINNEYGALPDSWKIASREKFNNKQVVERLIIAGALLAAEIDRMNIIAEKEKVKLTYPNI